MSKDFETFAITIVSILLIIFIVLYFHKKTDYKKLKNKAVKSDSYINNCDNANDIVVAWTEQLQIIQAQLELMFQMSPVFIVCFDFPRDFFSLSDNGVEQLNIDTESDSADQKAFEELIHPDDIGIYEDIKRCENIRLVKIAASPYILRLKAKGGDTYSRYIIKIKPVYDSSGESIALILAFMPAEI